MGVGRVMVWVRVRVQGFYKNRVRRILFLYEQKKYPKGTARASMIFLVTAKTEVALAARGNLLGG